MRGIPERAPSAIKAIAVAAAAWTIVGAPVAEVVASLRAFVFVMFALPEIVVTAVVLGAAYGLWLWIAGEPVDARRPAWSGAASGGALGLFGFPPVSHARTSLPTIRPSPYSCGPRSSVARRPAPSHRGLSTRSRRFARDRPTGPLRQSVAILAALAAVDYRGSGSRPSTGFRRARCQRRRSRRSAPERARRGPDAMSTTAISAEATASWEPRAVSSASYNPTGV
jgi:hypothetical protein